MMQVNINGRVFSLVSHSYPTQDWGEVDFDNATISIHEDVSGKGEMDTLFHEVRHCTNPEENEEEATKWAAMMTEIFYGYGYRKGE